MFPVSAADRQRKRRARLKENGKYDLKIACLAIAVVLQLAFIVNVLSLNLAFPKWIIY